MAKEKWYFKRIIGIDAYIQVDFVCIIKHHFS